MTTSNHHQARRDRVEGFIASLDEVVESGDRARLAALRGLLAPPDRWRPDQYAAGMPFLPGGLTSFEQKRYLLVAGLYAQWHRGESSPSQLRGVNFGESMRTLARQLAPPGEDKSTAVERRFSVLLASEGERLHHYLRQSVDQLAAAGIEIDFARLLDDILRWGHESRYIQRQWAASFWVPTEEQEQEN